MSYFKAVESSNLTQLLYHEFALYGCHDEDMQNGGIAQKQPLCAKHGRFLGFLFGYVGKKM